MRTTAIVVGDSLLSCCCVSSTARFFFLTHELLNFSIQIIVGFLHLCSGSFGFIFNSLGFARLLRSYLLLLFIFNLSSFYLFA